MNEQWKELKETIIELRDNGGTGTQQEVCKFLANLMDVIEQGASLINAGCEDCISRQAVIDVTWEEPSYTDALNVLTEVRDKVKVLPPVTPQPKMGRWIPVSERLPGDGKYLVTRGDVIGRPMIGMRYFSKDLSKVDEYEFESKKGVSGWCEYDSEYGWYIDDKVTAWMPLPEPYKAESENKE